MDGRGSELGTLEGGLVCLGLFVGVGRMGARTLTLMNEVGASGTPCHRSNCQCRRDSMAVAWMGLVASAGGGRSQLKTAAARVEDRLSDQMLHDSIVSTASTYSKRAGVIRPFGGRKKNSRCHHWTGAHRLISVSSVPMLYTYPSKNKDARMQMQILCTVGT